MLKYNSDFIFSHSLVYFYKIVRTLKTKLVDIVAELVKHVVIIIDTQLANSPSAK